MADVTCRRSSVLNFYCHMVPRQQEGKQAKMGKYKLHTLLAESALYICAWCLYLGIIVAPITLPQR